MKNHFVTFSIFAFLFISCQTAKPVEKNTLNEAVQNKMEQLVLTHELPGFNFSIIYANGQQENYSSGFSDVENQIPLTTNHLFFSGSIGKTYAVALLMQLVDEGKVDLKKPLKSYFPAINWLTQLPNIEEITIEMLLQHRSGLPRWIMKKETWDILHNQPDKVWSYKERLSYVFNEKPIHEAGKDWAYSDTNYLLIGMLIEKISGKPYYDLIQDNIIKAKKLSHTFPSLKRDIPRLAIGYSKLPAMFSIPNKVVNDGKYVFNPQVEWTGGGMYSTTADLAKWAKIYYEGQLFSEDRLNSITAINPNGEKVTGKNSYGMGSFIYHTKYGDAFGHSGFMPGFNSLFIYFPKDKIAIALQANADYADQEMSLEIALEMIYPLLSL